MQMESAYGRANRQLADNEWVAVKGGGIFLAMASFYRGRRERVRAGPSSQQLTQVSSRAGEREARARFPYPGSLTGGPWSVF
jgi:hypothetical protein